MEYEIVLLPALSGERCAMYSIVPAKGALTMYETFVQENIEQFRQEVRDINYRLRLMGTTFGARHSYFKHFEGRYGDFVCALYDLPQKNLRLYCIRYGTEVVILGGGGLKTKKTRAWQDDPKLSLEATSMINYTKDITRRMNDGELHISKDNPALEGTFNYFNDKDE